MSKQTEITERTPLLLPDGNLNAVGWCRHCLADYNKNFIPAFLRPRKKEWDFYQISDGNWLIQINFANFLSQSVNICEHRILIYFSELSSKQFAFKFHHFVFFQSPRKRPFEPMHAHGSVLSLGNYDVCRHGKSLSLNGQSV